MTGITNSIHVALCFDENFWAPAYATMRSVCLATKRRKDLVFHLCHTRLAAAQIADLESIGGEFGATLRHYDPAQAEPYRRLAATMAHTKYLPAIMYARLLFADLLDPGIDRLVYLDCDLLVRAPIEELAGLDLEGKPLGAVKEPHALRFSNGRDANERRDLFDPADAFFNSGVLLIDLEAWRARDIPAMLRRLESGGVLPRLSNDQEVLNHLFKHDWQEIERSWNSLAASRAIEMLDPKIVHYTGPNKPWNLVSGLPFARIYRHVMTNDLFYRYLRFRWARYWTGGASRPPGPG
ncbi:MAG: glycosyltransferase family 8 protein [Cucumibacter sp.]